MKGSKYMIQVYTSFVTSSHLYVKGRVLKDRFPMSFVRQGPISSLFNTILRARSKELPNIPIRCEFGTNTFEALTDEEGYFEIIHNIQDVKSIPEKITISGEVKGYEIRFDRELRLYLIDVKHGIISDIDDTIMVSKVRSFFKLRMLINTIFINPFRRRPIGNAAEAFHSILESKKGLSPMIYLSNSPWNIYDYLQAFLLHNAFPIGELLLRDIGVQTLRSKSIEELDKYIEIEKLLIAFKDTSFTLIGDTGEKDFDIYKAILEKYPHRIDRIILNDTGNRRKNEEVSNYLAENKGVDIRIVKSFLELI